MPLGDWGQGSKARVEVVNVSLDASGRVVHCGIGFHVVAPSGRVVASSGHTWGGTDSQPPEPHRTGLQALMDALVEEMLASEGLSGLC